MCDKCGQYEMAAEMSTDKWLAAERNAEEISTALTEARLRLAADEQALADVRALAAQADQLEFHQLRALLARISKRVSGGVAKAG